MKLLIVSLFTAIIITHMPEKPDSGTLISLNQSQKPLFSFGVVADVQYCDCEPEGTRIYRSSLSKLREAVNSFKSDSVHFVVNLGDLIDRDFSSYIPVLNILDSSGLKVYHVTGNHDYSVDSRYKNKLPVLKHNPKGYYSFVHKNFRFIFLNGNEISTYSSDNKKSEKKGEELLISMKTNQEINAMEWNGGFSEVQIDWLKKELDSATEVNEKVFLICHFPAVPENIHNLLNYKEVLTLLNGYHNIVAWFNGHNHAGNYGNYNMIHFVTYKGMVETESTNSFAIVDVYRNKLWIRGSGREKSMILAY
jgi:manganese-dependent ADP-ribose/CDP-alcohol diphosphatase